jgi:hypothetical protein
MTTKPGTMARMDRSSRKMDIGNDINDIRRHMNFIMATRAETAPEKRRTILRHPVAKE